MLAKRGDTIVEVILAFAVFAVLSVGAVTVMNRGVAMAERSLETTLVREQMDAQAEILRYARDTDAAAWGTIRLGVATAPGDECPDTPPAGAFIASVSSTGVVTYTSAASAPASFNQPATYSQFTIDDNPQAYGIWVVPIQISPNTFDMHIRACWHTPGDANPVTLGTIVRLYET